MSDTFVVHSILSSSRSKTLFIKKHSLTSSSSSAVAAAEQRENPIRDIFNHRGLDAESFLWWDEKNWQTKRFLSRVASGPIGCLRVTNWYRSKKDQFLILGKSVKKKTQRSHRAIRRFDLLLFKTIPMYMLKINERRMTSYIIKHDLLQIDSFFRSHHRSGLIEFEVMTVDFVLFLDIEYEETRTRPERKRKRGRGGNSMKKKQI